MPPVSYENLNIWTFHIREPVNKEMQELLMPDVDIYNTDVTSKNSETKDLILL